MSAAPDGDKLADMGSKERRPLDLDSSKIQRAIGRIEPDPYFDALAGRPGAVVLRAKEPVSRWQGLHVAASADWWARFTEVLTRLTNGGDREEMQVSFPSARGWYELYTTRTNFGCWWSLSVSLDRHLSTPVVWTQFTNRGVNLRLSSVAVAVLAAEIQRCSKGGIKSQLELRRDVRPLARPQGLWLWHWEHGQGPALQVNVSE
jgi:hypothetical protein